MHVRCLCVSVLRSAKFDLYKMCTNLKWDFNSENIAGFVVKPESNELASTAPPCRALRFAERFADRILALAEAFRLCTGRHVARGAG